jgi:Ras family protein T1
LLKERFDSDLPNVLPEISLPAQLAIGNVHTIIQDTPAPVKDGEGATEQISAAFKSANVICLCYAVDQRESFDRISTYWLPLIQSISPGLPVIVVGTKADMRTFPASTDTNATVSNVMAVAVQSNIITMDKIYLPLMNRFMEIETCLECSAKQMINVPEVFYFASKAVLYPTRPLFDTKSQRLLERPIEALTRIFHIIDCNKNGLLDDQELNAFQVCVFA